MTSVAFDFAGLELVTDERLLTPRAWTRAQSDWGAELLEMLPAGPVLELCAGAGHIGLAAVHGSGRRLVAVDREPVACERVRANAERLGMGERVETRCAPLLEATVAGETYALVIADPPWVPHDDIGIHPQDPPEAIDGGPDGLSVARECVAVIDASLAADGAALLQLGNRGQVADLALPEGLVVTEVREFPRGVLVRLDRPGPPAAAPSR